MKLNLGCGSETLPGYVNVDIRPECGDFTADVRYLPWPDACVTEIQAIDILEHFPSVQTDSILKEWRRVLETDGELILRVPNLQVLGELISGDGEQTVMFIRNVYGGHRWGPDGMYDTHHTGWTPSLLEKDLEKAGFSVLHNDRGANMMVKAQAI